METTNGAHGGAAEPTWISHIEAARLIGCHPSTIVHMTRDGRLVTRPGVRAQPSIDRNSALVQAAERHHQLEKAQARREQVKPQRNPHRGQAPDTTGAWITVTAAAAVLGIGTSGVHQRIRAGHLPSVLHGGLRWLRQVDVEIAANVKAFEADVRKAGRVIPRH